MDADLYHRIISYIQRTDVVLTEHVGKSNLSLVEQGRERDARIYDQDTAWLRESDLLIGECTCPSLGVGYELAYAEKIGVPCYLFCRRDVNLSAMLTGNPYFRIYRYETEAEVLERIAEILAEKQ